MVQAQCPPRCSSPGRRSGFFGWLMNVISSHMRDVSLPPPSSPVSSRVGALCCRACVGEASLTHGNGSQVAFAAACVLVVDHGHRVGCLAGAELAALAVIFDKAQDRAPSISYPACPVVYSPLLQAE